MTIILTIIIALAITYGAFQFGVHLEKRTYNKHEWYRKIFKK